MFINLKLGGKVGGVSANINLEKNRILEECSASQQRHVSHLDFCKEFFFLPEYYVGYAAVMTVRFPPPPLLLITVVSRP